MTQSLGARLGRRGAALLFFTFVDIIYGFGLLTAPRPLAPFHAWAAEVMPLPAWACIWWLVAAVCLFYAFRLYDTTAFMCAVGLKVAWGLTALFGWIAGQIDRGYLSVAIWLGFAAFVFLIAGGIPPAMRRTPTGRWRPWTRS